MSALRKPSGKWFYRVTFRYPDGRSERISGTPMLNTKAAAEDAERAHIDSLLHPAPVVLPPAPTFSAFAAEWLGIYPAAAGVRPSTIKNYEWHIKCLEERVRDKPLDQIDARVLSTVFANLRAAELAEGTVHNIGMTLQKILTTAKEWGIIQTVPTFPKTKAPGAKLKFYSKDETEQLIRATLGRDRVMLLFAFRTGARLGEQIALRWEDVDFDGNKIHIRRSYHDGVLSSPKNGRERTVPMSGELKEALRGLYDCKPAGLLVFYQDGNNFEPLEPWHVTCILERACRKCDVRVLRWHDLRHTFASQAMQSGIEIRRIQEWLGHSSITTTMRYAHLAPNADQVAMVNQLDVPIVVHMDLKRPDLRALKDVMLGGSDAEIN